MLLIALAQKPLPAIHGRTPRPVIVTYPTSGAQAYRDLLKVVRRSTDGMPSFYVLGLSFSGPLAAMLSVEEPKRVKGVILVATFARLPHPGLRFFRFACHGPTFWLWRMASRLPIWIARSRTDPLRSARAENLRRVSARCLAGRARAIMDVDVRAKLRRCNQPVHCIAFTNDRVVPRRNIDAILREVPAATSGTVAGGHITGCLNATALAAEVERFISKGESP